MKRVDKGVFLSAEEYEALTSKKTRRRKGQMARQLVYFCVSVLTAAAIWAIVVKTINTNADLSDVLTFVAAAFGGELLMLLTKRVFVGKKDSQNQEEE